MGEVMKKIKFLLLLTLVLVPTSYRSIENKKRIIEPTNYNEPNEIEEAPRLASVTFDDVDFKFSPVVMDYTLTAPYSKSTLGLHYVIEDKDSIVEVVGGEELLIGNNSIAILVTSKEGIVREYDFTIIRDSETSDVKNESESIKNAIQYSDSNTVTVTVEDKAATLKNDAVRALRNSKKTLIYKWNDSNGNFLSSLTIKGEDITSDEKIVPNIKRSISDEKLIDYVKGYSYVAVSTIGTNIPKNSVYKTSISGQEDIYYLYYYKKDLLNKKPLRNINNTVEFEVEEGLDFALMDTKEHPIKKTSKAIDWLRPSMFITVILLIFFLTTRFIMIKLVRHGYIAKNDNENR